MKISELRGYTYSNCLVPVHLKVSKTHNSVLFLQIKFILFPEKCYQVVYKHYNATPNGLCYLCMHISVVTMVIEEDYSYGI